MRTPEERLLNPRPGSKIAEAVKYGLDLTLVVENLRRTPQERLENLQASMIGLEELRQEAARSRKRAK